MMMILGFFVFSLPTATYQQLQRQTNWRHASNSRFGAPPAYQFVGKGEDVVTLDGTIYPEFKGSPLSLDALRIMGDKGASWPLIAGTGRIYGLYIIDSMSETQTYFFNDGAPRKLEFNLVLKQVSQPQSALLNAAIQIGVGMVRRAVM